MFDLVQTWKESNKTQVEFAREHNITLSKFRYWIHKSRVTSGESLSSGFIRISGNGFSMKGANDEIRLHYPNGTWLSLPSGIPVSVLKTLIYF